MDNTQGLIKQKIQFNLKLISLGKNSSENIWHYSKHYGLTTIFSLIELKKICCKVISEDVTITLQVSQC